MSFPRYDSYKDSGVEWLGEVPKHWDVVPFYSVASERQEPNKGMIEDNLLSLSYGRIVQKDISTNDGLLPESFETYQIVRRGDIVFRLTDLQNDKRSLRTAIVEYEKGIITSAYLAAAPFGIESGYLSYLLRAYDVVKVFYSMGGGLRQSMKFSDVKRLPILTLPKKEQQTIVAFLDRETGKIDALIAEQQRLIELLKEKRQSVISHAVTKGLNPNAPMKDSGIEWLGEVPGHWEIKRLGLLSATIQTGPFGSQLHSGDYIEDGTPVINPSNIQDDKIVPDWSNTVGHEIVERLSQHKLKAGDIIFGRRGEMGRCAKVSDIEIGWLCGTGCLNVRLNAAVLSEFVSIYFGTAYVREFLKLESVGSTMDNLNTEILSRIPIPVPLLEEQQSIAAFLDSETTKLDTLTTEAKTAITLLQERRTALISAAVTGKIDVRGLVSPA